MRQSARPAVPDDAGVVEDFLKLGGGSTAMSGGQICLSSNVGRIKAGNIGDENYLPQLDGCSRLQGRQGGSRVLSVQRQLRLNRWQPKRLHLRVQRIAFPQVLGQGLGSCSAPRDGKRKRGFHPDTLAPRSRLPNPSPPPPPLPPLTLTPLLSPRLPLPRSR